MKTKKVKIPLYVGRLIIYQVDNIKEIEKKHNLTDCTGVDALAFQINKKNGSGRFFMAFEGKTTPSIIAHEATHITNLIFSHFGAELDLKNDEPQAYLLEWVVNECHKFLEVKNK